MTDETRTKIETLIKELRKNMVAPSSDSVELSQLSEEDRELLDQVAKLGFDLDDHTKLQVLHHCDDLPAALDWLCLYLPEEKLPEAYGPTKSTVRIFSFGKEKKTAENVTPDQAKLISEFVEMGFPYEDSKAAVLSNPESSQERNLQSLYYSYTNAHFQTGSEEDLEQVLSEEAMVLESILGTDFVRLNSRRFQVLGKRDDVPFTLDVQFPSSVAYPNCIPIMTVFSTGIPEKSRPKVILDMAQFASTQKGQPIVYAVVDWISSSMQVESGQTESQKQTKQTPQQMNLNLNLVQGPNVNFLFLLVGSS